MAGPWLREHLKEVEPMVPYPQKKCLHPLTDCSRALGQRDEWTHALLARNAIFGTYLHVHSGPLPDSGVLVPVSPTSTRGLHVPLLEQLFGHQAVKQSLSYVHGYCQEKRGEIEEKRGKMPRVRKPGDTIVGRAVTRVLQKNKEARSKRPGRVSGRAVSRWSTGAACCECFL